MILQIAIILVLDLYQYQYLERNLTLKGNYNSTIKVARQLVQATQS